MQYETILYEKADRIGKITLNRPKVYNAINLKMLEELDYAFLDIEKDSNIKVVIITGGEKCFASGADITAIGMVSSPVDAYNFMKRFKVFDKIENFDKPVIAAISGFALGGGCELSMCCDIRIAAESAKFGQPEIKIGIIPGAGGTQRLPRLIGVSKAKELLYTGDMMDAKEAYRFGFVSKLVPVESLMDEARAMALKMAQNPGVALRVTKLAVNNGMNMDIKSAMAYEASCLEILFSTEDRKEGTKAFVEKKKPVFIDR